MSRQIKLREKWQGPTDTVMRFPLTVILLIAATVTNVIAITSEFDISYTRLLITFLLGAAFSSVLQLIYERFLDNPIFRIISMVATIFISATYFMVIHNLEWRVEVTVRTTVLFFILLIAFLWIPTFRSHISINESFMAAFRSFFTALLFDAVLFLGVVIIIVATDQLIVKINEEAYAHAANFIFVLLAPIYFLSLIPSYPGKRELLMKSEGKDISGLPSNEQTNEIGSEGEVSRSEELLRITTPAKFLESLISYVFIPITAIFTIILLLYIIINITGEFWSDNLMEPMLVSYSITVIIVYILASTIKNPFAGYFRLIFPKVLIPIVLFQTLSSSLKISDVGITYGRYYVILFGVFATIAGILFSILPIRRNGLVAPILIILSVISILPPIDAFTLSKVTQTERLKNTLIQNEMLSGDTITPNSDLSEKDKSIILSAVNYLDRMDYTKSIDYLHPYYVSLDFDKTFGFSRYDNNDQQYQSYYISRDTKEPVLIAGNDYMIQMSIYNMAELAANSFEVDGVRYNLRVDNSDKNNQIILLEKEPGQEILRYEYNNLFSSFSGTGSNKELIPTEQLTFRQENEKAAMTIIANSISQSEWAEGKDKSADLMILIDIK
jgi:hypothetical protein